MTAVRVVGLGMWFSESRRSRPVHSVTTTSGEAQGQDWKGSWNGEFYGQGAVDGTVPSSVAGLFNAAFGCNEMGGCAEGEGDDAVVPAEVGFVGVSGVFGADHSENFAQPTAAEDN